MKRIVYIITRIIITYELNTIIAAEFTVKSTHHKQSEHNNT